MEVITSEKILAVVTCAGFIATIIGIILGWRYHNKRKKSVSKERAEKLSEPVPKKDICWGRDKLLKAVFKTIEGEGPSFFVGNHVYIAGQEGQEGILDSRIIVTMPHAEWQKSRKYQYFS